MTERNDSFTGATGGDDADAIRAEIADTRDRLGDTLEQIGERLNPRNVAGQVKERVRSATTGRAGEAVRNAAQRAGVASEPVAEKVREYPLTAVIAAAGLGWLLAGRRSGGASSMSSLSGGNGGSSDVYTPTPASELPRDRDPMAATLTFEEIEGGTSHGSTSHGGTSHTGSGRYAGGASSFADVSGSGSSVGSSSTSGGGADSLDSLDSSSGSGGVRAAAGQVAGRVRETASQTASRVRDAGSSVADRAQQQARSVEDRVRQDPLPMGAAALALGLAAGFAAPISEREVELMGSKRDELMDRARGAAREATQTVKTGARDVLRNAASGAVPSPS